MEEHHYNPVHTKLLDLGLQPHLLSDVLVDSMIERIKQLKHRIKPEIIQPSVKWNPNAEVNQHTEALEAANAGR